MVAFRDASVGEELGDVSVGLLASFGGRRVGVLLELLRGAVSRAPDELGKLVVADGT